MSQWCDQGTYLERDPEDYKQLTVDEACAELELPPIEVKVPPSYVVVEIHHPSLADKGGVLRGYIALPPRWTTADLANQVPALVTYGLNDVLA